MDPVELGHRLRDARNNRNLNQDEVAEALELPRTAIVKIETGERSVSTLELAQLADLYVRPVAQFFSEESLDDDVLVALYRLDPAFSTEPQVREAVLHAVSLYGEGVALERLLGRTQRGGPPAYSRAAPRNNMEAILQGIEVAEEERERLGLGNSDLGFQRLREHFS